MVKTKYHGTRMFHLVHETWNPVTGCRHYCRYCWARLLVLRKLRFTRKYRGCLFNPTLHEYELERRFRPGVLVFCCDMGDLFGDFIPSEWILKVLSVIKRYPETKFLLLTKNPKRYLEFLSCLPSNVILGCTIETNRDDLYVRHGISKAPLPSMRYRVMRSLNWSPKMVSIEPILDFDLDVFVSWIKDVKPDFVYVGYDNYCCGLPEPPLSKAIKLINELKKFTQVYIKTLKKGG